MYKPDQKWLDKHHAECRAAQALREPIQQLTMRQMSAKLKRETGITAGQITMYQNNENDLNRESWSACISGIGWISVEQKDTYERDPKSEAERNARIEVYIELILGGPELVQSMKDSDR